MKLHSRASSVVVVYLFSSELQILETIFHLKHCFMDVDFTSSSLNLKLSLVTFSREKKGKKRSRSHRVGSVPVKCCFRKTTWVLHSQTYSIYGNLHKTCIRLGCFIHLGHQPYPNLWHRDLLLFLNVLPSLGTFLASYFNLKYLFLFINILPQAF